MKQIAYSILFLLILFLSIYLTLNNEKRGELKPVKYIGSYTRDFGDLNKLHLLSAKKIGIDPLKITDDLFDDLEKIETCEYYELQKLTHSSPYLVAEVSELLEDIGRNFKDSLRALNAPEYKVLVTSVFRTDKDVKRLRKRNSNASKNSAHCFATTFDISWARYVKVDDSDTLTLRPDQLKKVLAMVLRDLKRKDRCYVKHEKRQGCFHITSR